MKNWIACLVLCALPFCLLSTVACADEPVAYEPLGAISCESGACVVAQPAGYVQATYAGLVCGQPVRNAGRVLVAARPVRRVGVAILRSQPLRRVANTLATIRPLRRVGKAVGTVVKARPLARLVGFRQ